MSLTKEQIDQFTIFGFVQLPQLFDPQEIGKILKVSDAVWASELGRAPQGAESLSISLFVEREPDLVPFQQWCWSEEWFHVIGW